MAARTTRLAKLTRPATAATYSRTRLFEELDKADAAPVVWLVGPPGSGKTTLIADYTTTRRLPSLWYQVDRGDTDIASFFFYLAQALQAERRGGKPLPQFESAYAANVELFARNYFRDLYARFEKPCVVFDNCQDVDAKDPLYGVLRVAIDELPPGGRLFIISRLSPAAGFARLRARGRLRLIGWAELRFTLEEAAGVAAVRNPGITSEEVERLHARTHGWAAGFILLLQDRKARASTVSAPDTDTPSVIFDYLAEEVLQRFNPATHESLLRLAYLPQITVPMADELGIPVESRNTLMVFAQNGFLVTVIPAEPLTIYQLHPLLREFLEARAEMTGSAEEIANRKRMAAGVLAANEHFEAAAALLVRLRDWAGLESQILTQADALLAQGRGQTLENWISALPEAQRGENPWLLYWLATARYPYTPRDARELYARAFRLFTRAEPVSTAGVLASINGALEATLHDPDDFSLLDPWIEAGAKWIAANTEWPTQDLEARLSGNMFVAMVLRQPWHPDVPAWRERTQRLSQTHRDPNVRLSVDAVLITLSAWNGGFTGAERLVEHDGGLTALANVTDVSTTKFAQAQAIYYMLAGDRARCTAAVRTGLDIVARSGVRIWNDTFLINALSSALGEADLEDAAHWLKALEARGPAPRRFDLFMQTYAVAWYAMLRGELYVALQQLKTAVRTATELGAPFFEVVGGLALTQVLQASGSEAAADRELARTLEIAGRLKNRLLDCMCHLCRATVAIARGREAEALGPVREGLAIARERGIMHWLWWEAKGAADLCRVAFGADIECEYLRHLIQRRGLLPDPPPYLVPEWPWRWRIRALGPLRVESAAAEPVRGGKAVKPLELLSALVAFGGEQVRIERLADALWPHVDSDYAHRSFNTTVHRLREWLGDDAAVVVEGGEVSLNRRLVWLDTWAFEQAARNAQALCSASDLEARKSGFLAAMDEALTLYRGPLLGSDVNAAWATAGRERYRASLVRLVTSAAQATEKMRWLEEMVEICRRAFECEPLSDALCRRQMTALVQAGRGAEAGEVFLTFRTTLQALKLGEPSAATVELYRKISAEPERAPPASSLT
jgi:ATP/maltotriose-dependent transcriptional regulator MalT/DNA-binding SARP family transcriptional activator